MTDFSRRQLLAGTAAIGALAAMPAGAREETPSPAGDPDLTGKSILITGCSSGFGYLGALYYARLGAKVFATMRNTPRPEGEDLKRIAAAEELDLHVLRLDVLLDEEIAAAVEAIENELDGAGLDVLVNNAGIGISGPVELQDMEATRLVFDTNVFGYHRLARAVLPGMRAKGGGQIFMVSSQLGRVIVPGAGHYSATKFATEALAEQLAYELVPHNIEVTIIEPGGYPTEVWQNRNIYTAALVERASEIRKSGYPQMVAQMGTEDGSGRSTDPLDVPRAIAEIIGMEPGTRPLRRAVHPGSIPQRAINEVCRQTQLSWLGDTPYGPWIRAAQS
ncbi:MAG: SDR family oxidoreductase [Parasphingopyxis sp.]|nr:SDR family oxidoreductase [Sphingomonadales bacterium]